MGKIMQLSNEIDEAEKAALDAAKTKDPAVSRV